MTIFCVRDGDSSGNIWNQPLKKVEQTTPAKPEYAPTNTPGIVQNTKTGKLETNFPELEDDRGSQIPLVPLTDPEFQPVSYDELPEALKPWVQSGGLRTDLRHGNLIAFKLGKRFIYRVDTQDNWTVKEDLVCQKAVAVSRRNKTLDQYLAALYGPK